MTAQSVAPPAPPAVSPCEIAPFCPEAQADGVPCEDSSSECISCAHLVEAITGVSRAPTPDFTAEDAAGAENGH